MSRVIGTAVALADVALDELMRRNGFYGWWDDLSEARKFEVRATLTERIDNRLDEIETQHEDSAARLELELLDANRRNEGLLNQLDDASKSLELSRETNKDLLRQISEAKDKSRAARFEAGPDGVTVDFERNESPFVDLLIRLPLRRPSFDEAWPFIEGLRKRDDV